MYSDKKNILQLVALLKAHGVRKIVLCPGSRNAAHRSHSGQYRGLHLLFCNR